MNFILIASSLYTGLGHAEEPDPTLHVPVLQGTRIRSSVPITPTGPDCSREPTDQVGPFPATDVVVLGLPTSHGSWSMRGHRGQASDGEVTLPHGLSAGSHQICVETEQGSAVVQLEISPPGATQISIHDLHEDGSERGRSVSLQRVDEATRHLRWHSPDAVFTETVYDGEGRSLEIERVRDWTHSIYRNQVALPEPTRPGDWVLLDQRLIVEPFRITEVAQGEYRYAFTHRPHSRVPTRYFQVFLLPPGAELIEAPELRQATWSGRTMLTADRHITAGGSATTTFRYRMAGDEAVSMDPHVVRTVPEQGAVNVDTDLREIRVTFSADMRDQMWSWVRSEHDAYPKVTGTPEFVDPRTCVLPVKLKKGRTYTIWINHAKYLSFRGAKGGVATPYALTFTTADE